MIDLIGTPLTALRQVRPPGSAQVLVKLETANRTFSMKDQAALAVVRRGGGAAAAG